MTTKSTTPSTQVEVHVHQWCHQYDALLEDGLHRVEWCGSCGTTRVKFPSGWWYQIPDIARPLLARSKEVDRVIKGRAHKSRLGRGLKDLRNLPGGQHLTLILK